jgi:hypothetical protein
MVCILLLHYSASWFIIMFVIFRIVLKLGSAFCDIWIYHMHTSTLQCLFSNMAVKIAIEYIPKFNKNITIISKTRFDILLVFVEPDPNRQKRLS